MLQSIGLFLKIYHSSLLKNLIFVTKITCYEINKNLLHRTFNLISYDDNIMYIKSEVRQ